MIDERATMEYFAKLDGLVSRGTELYIFGGSAIGLLGAKVRTTIDIDVAAPFSRMNLQEFKAASEKLGMPVNPGAAYQGAFIELVGPARLSLPSPTENSLIVFRGMNLTVKTGAFAELVASKLVRYSVKDMQDVQFLITEGRVKYDEVVAAVKRLSPVFRDDPLVKENLENLKTDMMIWEAAK